MRVNLPSNKLNKAQKIVAAASATHPSDCANILSLIPAASCRRAGVSIHIMDDGSAVAVGSGWYQADAVDKVSADDYAVTVVLDEKQSSMTYGHAAVVAALGAGGVATAYGSNSTAITSGADGGMAATGVDGRAVSLTAQGLLRGEAGSVLKWLLDTCSQSVTLKVGRGEAGVAGKWYRLGVGDKPCSVCK